MRRAVLRIGLLVGAVWLISLVAACAIQERLLYFPDPTQVSPSAAGLEGADEVIMAAPDGARLVTWRAEPDSPEAPTILYFPGNASNLANRASHFALMREEGWGLAALSYRSYGGSTGKPSEAANVADAFLLYDALVADGVPPHQIVVYGESLGSGMAVRVAAAREVRGLILHAPYASVEDVAARIAPFLLPRLILRDRYRSIDHIGEVRAPLLWLHGDADRLIPMHHGLRLVQAASVPTTVWIGGGVDHNGVFHPRIFEQAAVPWVNALMDEPDTVP